MPLPAPHRYRRADAPTTGTCCAADERTRRDARRPSRTPAPFDTPASPSNSISGICGGPLWRIAMPRARQRRQPFAQPQPHGADMAGHVGLARDPQRRARRRHRHRAAPERPRDEHLGGGFAKPVVAGHGRQRIAVGDRLAPGAQIRAHAERLPASPDVEPQAGAHLVEDQRGIGGVASRARGRGKLPRRQFEIAPHVVPEAGDQDRGKILARFVDGSLQARDVVIFEVQQMRAILAGDAGDARRTPGQRAVIAALRDQHLAPPGAGAGDRHAGSWWHRRRSSGTSPSRHAAPWRQNPRRVRP